MINYDITYAEVVEREFEIVKKTTETRKVLRIPVHLTIDLVPGTGKWEGQTLPHLRSLWIRGWAWILGAEGKHKISGFVETDDPEVIAAYMNQYNKFYGEARFPVDKK